MDKKEEKIIWRIVGADEDAVHELPTNAVVTFINREGHITHVWIGGAGNTIIEVKGK